MDFVTFLSQAGKLFADSDSAYYLVYAFATCLLTQAVKKLFLNKAKTDILHKFDWAKILPFCFGAVFAVLDVYLVSGVREFSLNIALHIVLSALAIGALATTAFRIVKSLSGQSLEELMKNDLFAVFYNQLVYFGDIRQQVLDKKLTLREFVDRVKLLAASAETIYSQEGSVEAKRCQLARLLSGIIDDKNIDTCVNVINEALIKCVEERKK